MNREYEQEDLIELGVASVETKGLTAGKDDHQVGLIPFAGLSDE
jgi:hypothetical protein